MRKNKKIVIARESRHWPAGSMSLFFFAEGAHCVKENHNNVRDGARFNCGKLCRFSAGCRNTFIYFPFHERRGRDSGYLAGVQVDSV